MVTSLIAFNFLGLWMIFFPFPPPFKKKKKAENEISLALSKIFLPLSWLNPQAFRNCKDLISLAFEENLPVKLRTNLLKPLFCSFSSRSSSDTDFFLNNASSLISIIGNPNHLGACTQNHWELYCTARSACFYGFHEMAFPIFTELLGKLNSEAFLFWLKGLADFSAGESMILQAVRSNDNQKYTKALSQAPEKLSGSLVAIQALSSCDSPRTFQNFFLVLRIRFLKVFKLSSLGLSMLRQNPKNKGFLSKVHYPSFPPFFRFSSPLFVFQPISFP